MWKQRAVTLCGCLAALPLLIGCANGIGGPRQADAPAPAYPPLPAYAPAQAYAPTSTYASSSAASAALPNIGTAPVYALAPTAPAAIVVMLPDAGEMMTANPQLWAAQGLDVVTPTPAEINQLVTDQERAMAQLIAEARALADAPVWLVGPSTVIETAMGSLAPGGHVSGVVVTSTNSGVRTCSEEMTYTYSGSGAPKVSVSKSGNACPPRPPFGGGSNQTIAPPAPRAQPQAPRIIETSLPAGAGSPTAQQTAVDQIANLIKSPPG
jgi:hypothetical protein